MVGIVNAHMFGAESAPGEHVNWTTPDIMAESEWVEILGMSTAEYASTAPHMIVFAL
jgi:hypothetical protein